MKRDVRADCTLAVIRLVELISGFMCLLTYLPEVARARGNMLLRSAGLRLCGPLQ